MSREAKTDSKKEREKTIMNGTERERDKDCLSEMIRLNTKTDFF